jgi:hypothetical protein
MHVYQILESDNGLISLHQSPESVHSQCQALDLSIKFVHLTVSFDFFAQENGEISSPSPGSAA